MLISLHDNYQRRIAHIDNALPKAMHYNDDKWNRNLAYGTGVFEFTIDRKDLEHESQLIVGNYISFRYNNRDYMFTILRSEKSSDDRKIIVHSEYLSLGLLKSTQDPLDPPQSHTLEWYLTQSGILVNSGIKLGINEVPDLVRKIKIDGEQTSLQRLTSFAANFGTEIEYVTTLNRDGTLKSLVVNFYKKFDGVNQGVGTNRQDLTLSYGKNVSGIKQTTDITDFFSMITPTGKDGLTITSLDRTEYDDDGNVLFFTKPGQSSIYAPQSAQRFPSRLIRTNNDYTDHKYSADGTTDQNTLYTLALNELKKYCDPSIVYDVTGFYDLNIGDTVKIFDASFNPPLMLQARVAEQTISFSNPSNNKTIFGNIIALESQASQALAGRLKELVDQATPYRFEIVSDNGLTFKNSTGSTTLTARVFKGSNVDEVSVDSFEWLIDGVKFGGSAKSQLVGASQVTGTAVVRYNAKIGDTVIGGLEVTLQDVSDGTDGKDAWSINMTNENVTLPANSDGIVTSYENSNTSISISYGSGEMLTPVIKGSQLTPNQFKIINPEYNILTGTKDFSGNFNSNLNDGGAHYYDDGYYNGFEVKSTTYQWYGLYQEYTITESGSYSFSAFVKSDYEENEIHRFVIINGVIVYGEVIGHKFNWMRDSVTIPDLSVGDIVHVRYEKGTYNNNPFSIAGYKLEYGSKATPWMTSISESEITIGTQSIDTVSKTVNYSNVSNMISEKGATSKIDYIIYICNKDGVITTITKNQTFSKSEQGTDGISPTVKINPDTSLTIVDAKGTITTPVLKGSDGTSGIIVSSVAPTSPQNGQLWQDTSTTPQIVKKWTGNEWVIWEFYAQNLKADNISVISSNLGDVSAGTVKLMADVDVNGAIKKHGIYQSKMGLLSSGPSLSTPSTLSNSQMGVANLNRGELRFIVTNYTDDLKNVQETGMSDQNTAFINFNSYDSGKDVMLIGSSGDIVFKGITSQDTPWIAMGNGAYYKNMFSRVYISYSVKATSTADIPLGVLPVGLRPFRGLHLTANAWAATLVNDRHIEVRTTGEVTLYNPANGASYDGEVSFTL